MDSNFYSKILTYLENHNSLNSEDFNVIGWKNRTEALLYLKSLHYFGNIFKISEIKQNFWVLTDKANDYIKNQKSVGLENAHENRSYDALMQIGRGITETVEENVLKDLEEKKFINECEIKSLEVTKGEGFSSKIILASDLTYDMITSHLWKDVIFSSYDYYRQTENAVKSGSCHVVYNFIADVRQALFELGFKEVGVPSIFEKSFLKFQAIEMLQDDFDCLYQVHASDQHCSSAQGNINLYFSFQSLRNSLFMSLIYEISALKRVPVKLFTIAKVFQNKELDSLNIPEYHALEIMISDYDLDFSNVLGLCSALFSRLNINYTDFKQAYFPYTSPTAGIYLYNEILDTWIRVGKGGIIRPEFTKTLAFAHNINVLRWGFSIEKILINKKDTDNIANLLR